jgi:ABC-2 type transport system permease protein
MSWQRIKGIILQEAYVARREATVWVDLIVVSTMSVVVFGFLSRYLTQSQNRTAATYVILGLLLWEVTRINQWCVSVNSLWNMWSSNLTNVFVTPISIPEYIAGNCILAFVKTTAVSIVLSVAAALAFDFNILSLGAPTLVLCLMIMTVFAWALGWLLLGVIFRYGITVQSVAWGTIFFLQPLCAVFFPLAVLPEPLHPIARLLPPRTPSRRHVRPSFTKAWTGLSFSPASHSTSCGSAWASRGSWRSSTDPASSGSSPVTTTKLN